MKKILLLFAALAAYCSASALELTFMLGSQKITPGETVEFTNLDITDYGSYREVMMKPELYLTTDLYSSKIKVTARCTSGQVIQMCAGGTCRAGQEVVKENVTIQTGAKMDLGFDYGVELDPGEAIPVVTTEFEAEDVSKAGTKISFVLVMSENGASLYEVAAADDLHAVEGGLAYACTTGCKLNVATPGGVSVYSAEVAGEGIVELPAGLYVYTFGNRSGKIYIR